MKELIEIYYVFFKIGAFTFGGGYTMLPLLQRDIVVDRGWAAEEDIIDYYAISQSLPGIIAANTAMMVGYRRKKIPGLVSAVLGMISPSIIIILLIAHFIKNFLHIEFVRHGFGGIRVAVAALIFKTVLEMGEKCMGDKICLLIFAAALYVFTFASVSPILPVMAGAAAGMVFKWRAGK
jgi:chromate transporter